MRVRGGARARRLVCSERSEVKRSKRAPAPTVLAARPSRLVNVVERVPYPRVYLEQSQLAPRRLAAEPHRALDHRGRWIGERARDVAQANRRGDGHVADKFLQRNGVPRVAEQEVRPELTFSEEAELELRRGLGVLQLVMSRWRYRNATRTRIASLSPSSIIDNTQPPRHRSRGAPPPPPPPLCQRRAGSPASPAAL